MFFVAIIPRVDSGAEIRDESHNKITEVRVLL